MRGKFLTLEERDKILELEAQGVPRKEIAKLVGRSQSAICYVINRPPNRPMRFSRPGDQPIPIEDAKRVEEVDLSQLPDNIKFRHINYAIP